MYIVALILFCISVISGAEFVRGYFDNYLSIETTTRLKGIAAIAIVLHHISQYIPIPRCLLFMGYVGYLFVAVFFFVSGYGLMYSYTYKEDYLRSFGKRRLLPIYIPYWIVSIVNIMIHVARGKTLAPFKIVATFLGFDCISGLWFVTAILYLYVAFYISFRRKNKYLFLASFIAVYFVACNLLQLHTSYTASISAFVLGLLWMRMDLGFRKWIRNNYFLKGIFLCVIFIVLFAGKYY